jgi:catechol 2,3-dioxygenase-like lactoylglutathione lyase family enzyme
MLQQRPMHAYIPAKDIARARRFYEGTLGFTATRELNGGVLYGCAGWTAAFLYETPNAGTSEASQAFWPVEDIEGEVADLKRRGVTMEQYGMPGQGADGIVDAGGAKAAWFKDSEGNIMALVEDR